MCFPKDVIKITTIFVNFFFGVQKDEVSAGCLYRKKREVYIYESYYKRDKSKYFEWNLVYTWINRSGPPNEKQSASDASFDVEKGLLKNALRGSQLFRDLMPSKPTVR